MKNELLRTLSTVASFAAVGSFALSSAPAFAVTHGLSIDSFTTDNSLVLTDDIDDEQVIGDDRGGIALTTNGVFGPR